MIQYLLTPDKGFSIWVMIQYLLTPDKGFSIRVMIQYLLLIKGSPSGL